MTSDAYFERRILPFNEGAKGRAEVELVKERLVAAGVRGHVVDVGAGPGVNASAFDALEGVRATTADLSPAALALAADRSAPHLLRSDAHALGLRDGAADALVMTHVLGHLQRADDALREVRRVLAPDGLFVAVTPNARYVELYRAFNDAGVLPYERDPTVLRYYDEAGLRALVEGAELDVVELMTFGASPTFDVDQLALGLLPADLDLGDDGLRERLLVCARRAR